jgi:hypothetical protein
MSEIEIIAHKNRKQEADVNNWSTNFVSRQYG